VETVSRRTWLVPIVFAVALLALVSPAAVAQSGGCTCGTGYEIDLPASADIGDVVTVTMHGTPGHMGLLFVSADGGQCTNSAYGTVCVDLDLVILTYAFVFDANGEATLTAEIPDDPEIVGTCVFLQFLTCGGKGLKGSSDLESICFTDGDVCAASDSIGSNFNGTDIDPGCNLWFSAVVDVKDLDTFPAVMHFRQGSVTFNADGADFDLPLPDSRIVISDTITSASTSFDASLDEWVTEIPSSYTGNIFLTGMGVNFPAGLPGGINPVTWAGNFSSDQGGVSFQWKWAAAVYCTFSDDLNALGVKPIDGSANNPYANSDHAGTPENFKDGVTGGARGGGGSNFTGSYTGTSTAACE
jgi:hypothetical protein